MDVVYRARLDSGVSPYLTDGKIYAVDSTVDIEGEQFYTIDDDDKDWEGCFEPYSTSLFEVVEDLAIA